MKEEDKRPFATHLEELRNRLIKSFVAVGVGFVLSYAFKEKLFQILTAPLISVMKTGETLIYTHLPEAFFTFLKTALLSGILLASPIIIYQFWMFTAPGLYQQEKRLRRGRELLRHESPLWERGIEFVAGVDEAGMGPLAGPVIASAVVLPQGFLLPGLDDSKILTARRREEFYSVLHDTALGVGVGRAEPEEVDRLNIYQAGLLAMIRAVAALPVQPQHLLIDARRLDALSIPQESLVGGDRRSASIAAASVVAKVTRDRIMLDFHGLYPRYGFDRNKGYPTAEHRAAVRRFGHSPIHRRTFMSGAADTHKSPGNHAPEAV